MTENKATRLSKVAREFNVGISTIVEFLKKKGHDIGSDPNAKISPEQYSFLLKEYSSDIKVKQESEKISLRSFREKKETIVAQKAGDVENEPAIDEDEEEDEVMIKESTIRKPAAPKVFEPPREEKEPEVRVVGKIDLEQIKGKTTPKAEESKPLKEEAPVVQETKKEEPVTEPAKEEVIAETISTPESAKEDVILSGQEDAGKAESPDQQTDEDKDVELKVIGKIDLDSLNQRTRPVKKTREEIKVIKKSRDLKEAPVKASKPVVDTTPIEPPGVVPEPSITPGPEPESTAARVPEHIKPHFQKLTGPTVVGRIELPVEDKKKPVASSDDRDSRRKKRKRIRKDKVAVGANGTADAGSTTPKPPREKQQLILAKDKKKKKKPVRQEVKEEDVEKQIKDTLARLTKTKSKGSKYRREKRDAVSQRHQEEIERIESEKNILKVTEFVSVNELSTMMNVPVNMVISTCMQLGLMVSINQRLDAETMALVADEFNYKVEFVSVELQEAIKEEEDKPEDLQHRPPIVTVMGHVDHGKTKLLDYIRNTNVVAGEAGGITQHIGAYSVKMADNKTITFLDTPGHEAFTAMRARGAQTTDVAIIVIAADDGVMPQTKEAINHASAAGVPIVFAINKIDKPTANPEKIKEELANLNYLVEDWGGKYQSQEIAAKEGLNVDLLLEKVLLEAELLDLKANPDKPASGTIIESTLDKGRGYVATILVKTGTLRVGDMVLAGIHTGHVKAMYNERNQRITVAGPSTPVLILGLDGAPQAGENFNVMTSEKEAREIANKRGQLQREQGLRTQKHITLDEIGRRIAIGNFQELNVIVKGDVDGSIEALSDSLIKLSTEEIQVNVIHKAVGQISESDILLAAASNAIIVGFQVRPSMSARKLAEKEEIDVRLYSIIYDAIEEIKAAMEGMLSPDIKEEIVATLEIREVFKVSKVGTIAGCMVKEGKLTRNTKIRVIRDGIVVHTGELGSLKRFKDDVKEVTSGYECGLNINNFNDIKEGDIVEGYTEVEVKKKL